MGLKNAEIFKHFFNKDHSSSKEAYFCKCGHGPLVQNTKKGYVNLINHVISKHKNYENIIQDEKSGKDITSYFDNPDPFVQSVFGWISLIVHENRELTIVEKPLSREFSKLKPISYKTVSKFISLVTKEVEKRISKLLPEKIGLVIDGWSEAGTHFMAVFAVFPLMEAPILLSFSPMLSEICFTAEAHSEYLENCLSFYGKTVNDVIFLVADNAHVNKKLAAMRNWNFIGCFAHSLNLAIKEIIESDEALKDIIKKVSQIMTKVANSLILMGRLRRLTHLKPALANATRWSSTFQMLDRYYKIRSELTSVLQDNVDNARLLLNVGEDILVEFYLRKFVKFNSIMLSLQSSSCSIKIASLYINGLLTKFPEYTAIWNKHLDLSPFERSINMVMKGDSINLEPSQKYLLKHFETNNEHENQDDLGKEEDTELDFAEEQHHEQIERGDEYRAKVH
jgi:hypothetical protein